VFLDFVHAEKMAGNTNVTIKCSNNRKLEINTQHIGEGSFRRAFMGRVVEGDFQEKGGFEPGDPLVIKMIRRDNFNAGSRHVYADVETQRLAKRLVEAFVREVQPRTRGGKPVRITMCSTNFVTLKESVTCGTFSSVRGEQVAIERPIPGNFEKFNSNSGWSAEQHNLPDALSHWTWGRRAALEPRSISAAGLCVATTSPVEGVSEVLCFVHLNLSNLGLLLLRMA